MRPTNSTGAHQEGDILRTALFKEGLLTKGLFTDVLMEENPEGAVI